MHCNREAAHRRTRLPLNFDEWGTCPEEVKEVSTREFADIRQRSIHAEPCSTAHGDRPEPDVPALEQVNAQSEDYVVRGRARREELPAVAKRRYASDSRLAASAGLEALDYLGIGWIVCTVSGLILVSNRTANNIVNGRDGLRLNSHGALSTTEGGNEAFVQILRRAAEGALHNNCANRSATVLVRRASGKPPLTLFVSSTSQTSAPPLALVMILDPSLRFRTTEADLYQLYGLSTTESRLALLLMEGCALEDCCFRLGISSSTGRAYVRRIFRKTSVHSQNQLVSVLVRSIGLATFA
jgi:DNA-binding NarL/FixJ family response regulator